MTAPVVLGFAVTGQAVAKVLSAGGRSPVVVEDRCAPGAAELASSLGVELAVDPSPERFAALLDNADLVVSSPGVPLGHPRLVAALEAGVPVWSEIELAWELARSAGERAPKLLAITGTNGKTTVTTAVADLLRAGGVAALAAGNIGLPLVEAVGLPGVEVVVAEVSSFQLHLTCSFRPAVSCWLNLADDHLDWHPDRAHYAAAKAKIWANQGEGDTAVLNADDPAVCQAASTVPKAVRRSKWSSTGASPADFVAREGQLLGPGGSRIISIAELPRALPHDVANALATAAVATAAGADLDALRYGLAHMPLLAHRVELVAETDGLRWYDDSKATTPASVLAAVSGFDSVVLIAGGRNKGLDLHCLAEGAPPVHAVVAIGEAAEEVARSFRGKAEVRYAGSMPEAVTLAGEIARPGDVVLLSPGCASFDWYGSYAERGDHFAALVRARLGSPLGASAPDDRAERGRKVANGVDDQGSS